MVFQQILSVIIIGPLKKISKIFLVKILNKQFNINKNHKNQIQTSIKFILQRNKAVNVRKQNALKCTVNVSQKDKNVDQNVNVLVVVTMNIQDMIISKMIMLIFNYQSLKLNKYYQDQDIRILNYVDVIVKNHNVKRNIVNVLMVVDNVQNYVNVLNVRIAFKISIKKS